MAVANWCLVPRNRISSTMQFALRYLTPRGRAALAVVLFWLASSGAIWAQQPAPVTPPAPAGGTTIVQGTRPLWTEMVITVLMIGLALFAVGRNSNRT